MVTRSDGPAGQKITRTLIDPPREAVNGAFIALGICVLVFGLWTVFLVYASQTLRTERWQNAARIMELSALAASAEMEDPDSWALHHPAWQEMQPALTALSANDAALSERVAEARAWMMSADTLPAEQAWMVRDALLSVAQGLRGRNAQLDWALARAWDRLVAVVFAALVFSGATILLIARSERKRARAEDLAERLRIAAEQLREAQGRLTASEERYALAARGANDGLFDWDLPSGIVYYSERFRQLLGLEPSDHWGAWLERVHPDDRTAVEEALESHMNGSEGHFEAEYRVRRGSAMRWMLSRGSAVRVDGRPVRIAGSLTDITERRHAAAAQEKAALLEEAMAAVGVGVALLDPKLTPCLPSPQLVAMTRSWPSVAAWFVDALELLGPVFPHQTRGGVLVDMGSPTGRRRVFSLSCTLRGAELMADATTPYVLLVRDKTASHLAAEQRLALTRELRAAHDDAVAANESKSEFIARLGLELRRAVGELTTAAGALDDTQETLAQTIRDEAGRVGATLARVAELNRVEAGSLPSEPVEVRAIDIIAPLIEEFEVRIAAVGSVFVHPKQADAVLVTDAGEVRRLLRELLDNALRSTPDGTVGLSIHPQGGTVDFVVRDTGAGIPEQLHEAVFEPFVRAGPDTHEGTGLGLSICRRTAERLGGGLQLRSATGSGTTVTLTLPCDAWTGRKKKAPQGP